MGFVVLIKSGDLLVKGASSLAFKLNISQIVIGLTVVAFGTSAPELVVNIFASIRGSTGITIGNVVGSNIANILLILGISSIISPLIVQKNTAWREIPFSLLATLVLIVMANDFYFSDAINLISRSDGIILLFFFAIFMAYVFSIAKDNPPIDLNIIPMSYLKSAFYIISGLMGLFFGGKFIVDSAIKIALLMGISETLIGFTIVAVGTSLPELVTSAIAAKKGNADIAVGNVVGSNIFNIFWILGISALIRPLEFNIILNIELFVLLFASSLLFMTIFIGKKHKLERWEGIFFLFFYLLYILRFIVMDS